jgi:hypothetical protein
MGWHEKCINHTSFSYRRRTTMLRRTLFLAQVIAITAPVAAFGATIVGNGGNVGVPDGSIPLPPSGDTTVQYVSTNGGVDGVGANPDGSSTNPTDGSTYTTATFTPGVGGSLKFAFNFISSDGTNGGSYPDNAWVDLVDVTSPSITELFSSTTTVTPLSGGTNASVLGSWSGQCYGAGCGNTGWESVSHDFSDTDTYYLEFGVVNANDTLYDSALYFDGAEENGRSLTTTPEPGTLAIIGSGLLALAGVRRLRRSKN